MFYCFRRIWEDYIRICHESKSLFGITFLQLKQSILGVEMRLTWGLNPLANEFQPQQSSARLIAVSSSVPVPLSLPAPLVSHSNFPTPAGYQYNRGRPRAPFIMEQTGGYFGYQNHHPDNSMNPHHVVPGGIMNSGVYPHGAQYYNIRQPYPSAVGMGPNYPPVVTPQAMQYNQPYPPAHGVHVANMPPQTMPPHSVIPPQLHIAQNRPPHYPSGPLSQSPYAPQHMQATISQPYYSQNQISSVGAIGNNLAPPPSNLIYNPRSNSVSQEQFATGQPLYRRVPGPVATHAPPMAMHSAQPQIQAPYEARVPQNPPLHVEDHNGPHAQPKLTQEELNFIAQALSTDSGQAPGDIQKRIQLKLLQAMGSGGDTMPARLGSLPNGQQQSTNYNGVPSNLNQPLDQYGHPAFQSSALAAAGNAVHSTSSRLFAPIPQKSPSSNAPIDHLNYAAFPEVSNASAARNHPWPHSSNAFPSIPEPGNAHGQLYSHQSHGASAFVDANARFHNQLAAKPAHLIPNGQPHLNPRVYPTGNTGYPTNEFGYQADVGSGLKAQLSGGLRQQGFGERSAFSRVNGGIDLEVQDDTANLGRSYANVVKAAVTTAAVGSGLTATMSVASSNMNRQPIASQSSHQMYSNVNVATSKYYYGNGATTLHHNYGAHGP